MTLTGFRHKEPNWPALEKELLEWSIGWVRRHGTLTYALLREQALILSLNRDETKDTKLWFLSWHQRQGSQEQLGALEAEYEELGQQIPRVHPEKEGRMNAMEYVHDVMGENERQALCSDEPSPPSSPEGTPQSPDSPESQDDFDDLILTQV